MFDGFKDSVSHLLDRLKSPFGVMFIFVWIITNWEFVYYLIYVSNDVSVFDRIIVIKKYFDGGFFKLFFKNIISPAFYTFLAITTYFSFSLVAGIITGYFKRYLEPKISDKLGTGAVVLKYQFEEELLKRGKVQKELNLCEQQRNEEFKRNSEIERQLKSNITSLEKQLHYLSKHKNDIEERLQRAFGNHSDLIQMQYLMRIKELKLMNFRDIDESFFMGKMRSKQYNFYFDEMSNSFLTEPFSLDEPNHYIVDGVKKFVISNVKLNTQRGEIYFEKRDLFGILIHINLISYTDQSAQTFQGFEINFATQERYKILYSNIHLTDFTNFLNGD